MSIHILFYSSFPHFTLYFLLPRCFVVAAELTTSAHLALTLNRKLFIHVLIFGKDIPSGEILLGIKFCFFGDFFNTSIFPLSLITDNGNCVRIKLISVGTEKLNEKLINEAFKWASKINLLKSFGGN